jgi:hypothetical protein
MRPEKNNYDDSHKYGNRSLISILEKILLTPYITDYFRFFAIALLLCAVNAAILFIVNMICFKPIMMSLINRAVNLFRHKRKNKK